MSALRKGPSRARVTSMAAGLLLWGAVCLASNSWSPTPEAPSFQYNQIWFGGYWYSPGEIPVVDDAPASYVIDAIPIDRDYYTYDDNEGGISHALVSDVARTLWSCEGGYIADTGIPGWIRWTWFPPQLEENEDYRMCSVTATPDDWSDEAPGSVDPGLEEGNRDDGPGSAITLQIKVSQKCEIQRIDIVFGANASGYAPIGDDVKFKAVGSLTNLVGWTNGGTPATATGAEFTTKWTASGTKTVTATCPGLFGSASTKSVKVVEVTAITVTGGATNTGVGINNWAAVKASGQHVMIKATTNPDEEGAWALINWTGGAYAGANTRSVPKATIPFKLSWAC